jgi:hypothetical protein
MSDPFYKPSDVTAHVTRLKETVFRAYNKPDGIFPPLNYGDFSLFYYYYYKVNKSQRESHSLHQIFFLVQFFGSGADLHHMKYEVKVFKR